jgi:hypothetical protein
MAIANKYPALQVDLIPHKLVAALERGVYYGSIELVSTWNTDEGNSLL